MHITMCISQNPCQRPARPKSLVAGASRSAAGGELYLGQIGSVGIGPLRVKGLIKTGLKALGGCGLPGSSEYVEQWRW